MVSQLLIVRVSSGVKLRLPMNSVVKALANPTIITTINVSMFGFYYAYPIQEELNNSPFSDFM